VSSVSLSSEALLKVGITTDMIGLFMAIGRLGPTDNIDIRECGH
jgi:hypothetical protein